MKQRRIRQPNRQADRQQQKARVRSHGLLVTTLVLIGLFASLLVYIRGHRPAGTAAAPGQPAKTAAATPQAPKPKYDFYTELPKRQVTIGGETPATPAKPARHTPPAPVRHETTTHATATTRTPSPSAPEHPQAAPASARHPGDYLVQAGAFKLYSQADRIKARLAMLGIRAHIDSGQSDGLPIYRVRIGPLSEAAADAMHQRLSARNINSIKLKGD